MDIKRWAAFCGLPIKISLFEVVYAALKDFLILLERNVFVEVFAFEAADGVALKSAHGPAAVEDKNALSNIVFHDKYLRFE